MRTSTATGHIETGDLVRDAPYRWVVPPQGSMRVPGVIFA